MTNILLECRYLRGDNTGSSAPCEAGWTRSSMVFHPIDRKAHGVWVYGVGFFILSLPHMIQPWNFLLAPLGSTAVVFMDSIFLHLRLLREGAEPQAGVRPPRRNTLVLCIFPIIYIFCRPSFCIPVRIYEHAVEHLPQAQHSTAQHSTAQHSTAQHSTARHRTAQHSTAQRNQPCTTQERKYVPIRAPRRKQADRIGENQHVVEHSSLRCVLKTNDEIEICSAYKSVQSFTKKLNGVMREEFKLPLLLVSDLSKIQHCSFSPFFRNHRACMSSIFSASGYFRSSIGCYICLCLLYTSPSPRD